MNSTKPHGVACPRWRFALLFLGTSLLLAPAPQGQGDTPYSAEGSTPKDVFGGVPRITSLGQKEAHGSMRVIAVKGSDARMTGRRTVVMDIFTDCDGTKSFVGNAHQEVGTWKLGDPENPADDVFTPTGGMWEMSLQGTQAPGQQLVLKMMGNGIGGNIQGMRLEETSVQSDGTSVATLQGIILPAPLNTNLYSNEFTQPLSSWDYYGPSTYSYTVAKGHLYVQGHWPDTVTGFIVDSYTFAGPSTLPLWRLWAEGQTAEARVELVNLNASATAGQLILGTSDGFYAIHKGHGFMALTKWSSRMPWGPISVFACDKVTLPDTGVVLSLSVTRGKMNVWVTARVLDKNNPALILHQQSVADTRLADPSLAQANFRILSGTGIGVTTDPAAEVPFISGGVAVGVWQDNYDGQRPLAVATFDNLEVWQYDMPKPFIERTVTVSWENRGGHNWTLEWAPSVTGTWAPVTDQVRPGIEQKTITLDQTAGFLRLAPGFQGSVQEPVPDLPETSRPWPTDSH